MSFFKIKIVDDNLIINTKNVTPKFADILELDNYYKQLIPCVDKISKITVIGLSSSLIIKEKILEESNVTIQYLTLANDFYGKHLRAILDLIVETDELEIHIPEHFEMYDQNGKYISNKCHDFGGNINYERSALLLVIGKSITNPGAIEMTERGLKVKEQDLVKIWGLTQMRLFKNPV